MLRWCSFPRFDTSAILLFVTVGVNPLNAELNPIRHLLALVGARHIVHVSRIRVKGAGGGWMMRPHCRNFPTAFNKNLST